MANVDTAGEALHIHAFNNLAIVAERDRGVTVFNIFNAMAPVIVAQVATPGDANAVHYSGRYVAVADGSAGLAIIDIEDPPAATVIHQIPQTVLGGTAQAVVTSAGLAYVGLGNGKLAVVEMGTGTVLDRKQVMGSVQDLALSGDELYLLTDTRLHIYEAAFGLQPLATLNVSGSTSPLELGRKLFVGTDNAYVGHFQGYTVVDVREPANPIIVGTPPATQSAIHDLVTNGAGLMVATTSFTGAGTLAVTTYDTSDPTDVTQFRTTYETPGQSRGLTLYNGLAYVADTSQGLQVISYLAFDTAGIPPTISLDMDWGSSGAEEGKQYRVSAQVSDDVQVRNVEYYIDGIKAVTDGNYPFEYRFTTPRREGRTGFTLRARASDTGGNATWTELLNVPLIADGTPPQVIDQSPKGGTALGNIATVAVIFNEPIDETTLTMASFTLTEAGVDAEFDTTDDVLVVGTVAWNENLLAAYLNLEPGLTAGNYRASVTTGITDLAGNQLIEAVYWTFRVYDVGADRDGDGVPDDLEADLDLDPDNPDTNGDGIFDGDEDYDGDGLSNLIEVLLGMDPTNPDTDGDGIGDSQEDTDGDGLADYIEVFTHGTNPQQGDTDGDGFGDGEEVAYATNPLNRASKPADPYQQFGFQGNFTYALINRVTPIGGPDNPTFVIREASHFDFSALNRVDPSHPPSGSPVDPALFVGKAGGRSISALNRVNPSQLEGSPNIVGKAGGRPISALNSVNPSHLEGSPNIVRKAGGRPISALNRVNPSQLEGSPNIVGKAGSTPVSISNNVPIPSKNQNRKNAPAEGQ